MKGALYSVVRTIITSSESEMEATSVLASLEEAHATFQEDVFPLLWNSCWWQ